MTANIRHSSETNEHFTPGAIIRAAHATMGGIDVDPASTREANDLIGAKTFFDAERNGFHGELWHGRVFLNPPGGRCDEYGVTVVSHDKSLPTKGWTCLGPMNPCGHQHVNVTSSARAWWFRLAKKWMIGEVSEAIFVMFSIELFQVTQSNTPEGLPHALMFPFCLPKKRIAYDRMIGLDRQPSSSPPHSSAIIYLPPMRMDHVKPGGDVLSLLPKVQGFAKAFRDMGHVSMAMTADRRRP